MSEFENEGTGIPDFLRDPVGLLQRRWRWVVAGLSAGLIATTLALVLHVPLFVAEATVLVTEQEIADDIVPSTVDKHPIDRVNQLLGEVFTPRNLLNLIERYSLYPALRKEGDSDKLVSTMREYIQVENEDGLQAKRQQALILGISFESSDAQLSADVANDLANLFTEADLEIHSRQVRLTTEFLTREVEEMERRLTHQAKQIATFRQENRGELPAELQDNRRRFERLQDHRGGLVQQLNEAERRIQALAAGSFADESPGSQLQRREAELHRALAVHTDAHPNVIALRDEINALKAAAGNGSGANESQYTLSVKDARIAASDVREQIANLDTELVNLDQRMARTHQHAEVIAGMEEKAKVYTSAYNDLLRKLESARQSEDLYRAQQGAKLSILDAARPPLKAESRYPQIIIGGLFGSLALGLGLGCLLEWRDPVLSSAEGIKNTGGVPVFGTVPRIA